MNKNDGPEYDTPKLEKVWVVKEEKIKTKIHKLHSNSRVQEFCLLLTITCIIKRYRKIRMNKNYYIAWQTYNHPLIFMDVDIDDF